MQYVCLCSSVYTYNLFSPNKVTSVSMISRADHLIGDNQLACCPQGRLFLLLLAFLSCQGLKPHEISSFHVIMPVHAIVVPELIKQPYWWDFLDITSLVLLGDIISLSSGSIHNYPWAFDAGLYCKYVSWGAAPNALLFSVFRLLVVFHNGLHLLQR